MKTLTYIFILFFILACDAGSSSGSIEPTGQEYKISHKSLTYKDTSRNNRLITAELFYPTVLEDSSIADGNFSLIVFAHGYQQEFNDYNYIYEKLTPMGYILAFLTTEQGLTIDIDTFAEDITFLQETLLNSEPILLNHLKSTSALMGHSTGGGAIYLADAISSQSTTLISMAALGDVYGPIYGTNPIDIASSITTSSLILSGSKDCITPSEIHQQPLFNNLKGKKDMITIDGGDHCGFSDSFNCPKAEAASCGLFFQGTTIEETTQRKITLDKIIPWLNEYL
jgi:pimeloyl-ACP methyl ester carboxylesterase